MVFEGGAIVGCGTSLISASILVEPSSDATSCCDERSKEDVLMAIETADVSAPEVGKGHVVIAVPVDLDPSALAAVVPALEQPKQHH